MDIERYLFLLIDALRRHFGENLLYVGLQGSYLRGEATEESDIDVMVVLDTLTVRDLDSYRSILLSLTPPDRSCGFICSREDLRCWNPLEICHLLHSTKDYHGTLALLVPAFTDEDVRCFVRLSLNNLYHELCHRYVHSGYDKSVQKLPGTCKSLFFILQNLYWLEHHEFIPTRSQLLERLASPDREIFACTLNLRSGEPYDFPRTFELLLIWCQQTLTRL